MESNTLMHINVKSIKSSNVAYVNLYSHFVLSFANFAIHTMFSGGDGERPFDSAGEQGSGKKWGRGPTQLTQVINKDGK